MSTPSVATMQIPFFRYPHLFQQQRAEILQAVTDVMDRGSFILQSDLRDFEAGLRTLLGVGFAYGVANGTDGLIIALRAVGVEPGSEVIVPSHTYVASAASIHFPSALLRVLVDCLDDFHMIDPAAVEAAVTTKTTWIMPIQLNGRTAAGRASAPRPGATC